MCARAARVRGCQHAAPQRVRACAGVCVCTRVLVRVRVHACACACVQHRDATRCAVTRGGAARRQGWFFLSDDAGDPLRDHRGEAARVRLAFAVAEREAEALQKSLAAARAEIEFLQTQHVAELKQQARPALRARPHEAAQHSTRRRPEARRCQKIDTHTRGSCAPLTRRARRAAPARTPGAAAAGSGCRRPARRGPPRAPPALPATPCVLVKTSCVLVKAPLASSAHPRSHRAATRPRPRRSCRILTQRRCVRAAGSG